MKINNENAQIGNKAMASVLLLYYHLLQEGGITNDQTVYLDPEDFNGFDFLDLQVEEQNSLDINEELIRQGAVIYLLCDLNDMISEFDLDFHSQDITQKIIVALGEQPSQTIPEVSVLLNQIKGPESQLNISAYNKTLQDIYKKYVHGFFLKHL